MKNHDLHELARLCDVQLSYVDAEGKKRDASREALIEVLTARLREEPTPAALESRRRRTWERGIEPVIVSWGGRRVRFELRLRRSLPASRVEWIIQLEEGGARTGTVDVGAIAVESTHEDFTSRTLELTEALPFGYHTLTVKAGGELLQALLIVAPVKAHAPGMKTWGVFAPLYATHSRRSWGTGDLGDLLAYSEWVNHHGGGVVATLPMLAASPGEPSPYSPLSRLFWNEIYLDVDRLPELRDGDVDLGAIASLQQSTTVDYDRVRSVKRPLLEKLSARLQPDDDFDTFALGAREYAEFRARSEQRDSVHYHLYVQYRMAQQMREAAAAARESGVGLYLDFPLGVSGDGYDAWRYGELFAPKTTVGAPPDAFFTKGQNWGFPPLDPDAIREDRYDYFRACIRMHTEHAGVLRIDHVMGLHRLLWIPEGSPAVDGVYVRYRDEELYAILTIESQRRRCTIVGEDLGTVPQYVPRMMAKHGLRQMFVVQYESQSEGPVLGEPPAASVASVNTHDMPTFASFWSGRDIDDRIEQGLLDEAGASKERTARESIRSRITDDLVERELVQRTTDPGKVLEGIIALLASSEAEIVLVNLEDLWGETEPQNAPGVPEKSWRQKFRLSLEQVRDDAGVRHVIDRITAARPKRGIR